jgi:hypothetical protein
VINPLAQRLLNVGLIQFGWFQHGEKMLPFSLSLDMLASYPDILDQAASEAQTLISSLNVTRLLATTDAIPFGVAVSLRTEIPLVYSRGAGEAPVFDLIGAYDIGHPTLLLTNSSGWNDPPTELIKGARRVGLEVHTIVTLLETRSESADYAVLPLLRLADIARELEAAGQLPANHAQVVLQSLKS